MKKNKKRRLFIVFEGLDGSGQTTQINLLEKYLKLKGKKVHMTAEPSSSLIGGLIRAVLTHHWKLSNTGLQLLYCADRAHHLETEVYPALAKGNIVLSSRYFFSTIAFGSLNNDTRWLEKINEKFPKPDVTFFINVSPKECIKRLDLSRFRKEIFEKEEKMGKVLRTYIKIGKNKKYKNFFTINGEQPVEKISQDVIKIIDKFIR
ncbi:MAG: dTMP kinase [Candidatus Moranbacteria bacterium]|nr:dTMP kinase [Candidatus Moranbacteria bacterium]